MIYSCTKYRDKNSEVGIMYNDKDLNIKWPVRNPIVSDKDRSNLSFKDYKKNINNEAKNSSNWWKWTFC